MGALGTDILVSFFRVIPAVFRPAASVSSLQAMRSDLSHETAAKLARLIGLTDEWSRGRYRVSDPKEALEILRDLESAVARHARVAAVWFHTQFRFLLVLSSLCAARRLLRPARGGKTLSPMAIERLQTELERLRRRCNALVESLSRRYGTRIGQLVEQAAAEVRRERGGGLTPSSIPIVLSGLSVKDTAWVTLADGPAWEDLIRNLLRNAVDATSERVAGEGLSNRGSAPLSVRVALQPHDDGDGTCVEVTDQGVGMAPSAVEQMWRSGFSRHGDGRGRGLDESKLTFARQRGGVEVRSSPGTGTTISLCVPATGIPIRPVAIWRLRTFVLPTGLALVSILLLAWTRPAPVLADIQTANLHAVRGVDRRDRTLWTVGFEREQLVDNRPTTILLTGSVQTLNHPLARLQTRAGRLAGAVVSALPATGAGSLYFVDSLGTRTHLRRLRRAPPLAAGTEHIRSTWQAVIPWSGGKDNVILHSVRDGRHSAESVQVVGWAGDSLGAYYHPGHLHYWAAADIDGDGRTEILLHGINNPASHDSTLFSVDTECFVDCLVLLRESELTGQAYPYQAWGGMQHATEVGYLIVPPLRTGTRPTLVDISVRQAGAGQPGTVEFQTGDGRIYLTDAALRPVRCTIGNWTLADSLNLERPIGPLAYFREGRRTDIDLPIR